MTEQAWSLKDLSYGIREISLRDTVVPERSILPAQVANESAGFEGCPIHPASLGRFIFGICDLTNRKSIREPYSIKSTQILTPAAIRNARSRFARDSGNIAPLDYAGWAKIVVDSSQFDQIHMNRFPCCDSSCRKLICAKI